MFNLATTARKGVSKLQAGFTNVKLAASLAFVSMMALFAGPAMAQSDPAAAITSELSGLATSVGGIIVLLAAALAVIILWRYVKKAG